MNKEFLTKGAYYKVKSFYKGFLLLFLVSGFSGIRAQSVLSAKIENTASNRLIVQFDENITLSNADGFRLTGGVARISSLLEGSGSGQLTFELTDYILPDDEFELLYWAEIGNAMGVNYRLPSFEGIEVQNNSLAYNGSGSLYFVSASGSDSNSGSAETAPLKTINRAMQLVNPGDYILLKRNDTFYNNVIVLISGSENRYITFAAYGDGIKPILDYSNDATFIVRGQDYIAIDNLHFRTRKRGESGVSVRVENNSDYVVVSNCRMEGYNNASFGVHLQRTGGSDAYNSETDIIYPLIINNEISGFNTNIRISGYRYNDKYNIYGGLVENNTLWDGKGDDGANFQRGYFHNLIVRKNDISEYDDDGIDTYGAHDIIIEYNRIHDPLLGSSRGKAIKAGGIIRSSENGAFNNMQSTGVIIRYNDVRNIFAGGNCSCDGIVTNGGASGKIYGNLIDNVYGHGIKIDGQPKDWAIHNNTVVHAGKSGLQFYVDNGITGNVNVSNNILDGNNHDLELRKIENLSISGGKNITLNEVPDTDPKYSGYGDFQADVLDVFQNFDEGDFSLKENSLAIDDGLEDFDYYTEDIRGYKLEGKVDIGAFEYIEALSTDNSAITLSGFKKDLLTVFPNPVKDRLNINYKSAKTEDITIRLTDLSGREFYSQSNIKLKQNISINVENFSKGLYFLYLYSGEYKGVRKIIIK